MLQIIEKLLVISSSQNPIIKYSLTQKTNFIFITLFVSIVHYFRALYSVEQKKKKTTNSDGSSK